MAEIKSALLWSKGGRKWLNLISIWTKKRQQMWLLHVALHAEWGWFEKKVLRTEFGHSTEQTNIFLSFGLLKRFPRRHTNNDLNNNSANVYHFTLELLPLAIVEHLPSFRALRASSVLQKQSTVITRLPHSLAFRLDKSMRRFAR